jgi:GH15 family glucan-1,4-alpha-glucosidase
MILVRDVFRLHFGRSKEAVAAWREVRALLNTLGGAKPSSTRLLTDLVGDYYTLVFESTYSSLAEYEQSSKHMSTDEWRAWHAKVLPFSRDGHREIFNVVE